MEAEAFNKWSLVISSASLLVTLLSAIFILVTLRQTNNTIRHSSEQYAYDVWRALYNKLADNRALIALFGISTKERVDVGQLSSLLMILDMYANRYRGDYRKMRSEATLLHQIMSSAASRKLWARFKDHFFSDPRFVAAIDSLATQ